MLIIVFVAFKSDLWGIEMRIGGCFKVWSGCSVQIRPLRDWNSQPTRTLFAFTVTFKSDLWGIEIDIFELVEGWNRWFKSDLWGIEIDFDRILDYLEDYVQIRPLRDWNISPSSHHVIPRDCSNQTFEGLKCGSHDNNVYVYDSSNQTFEGLKWDSGGSRVKSGFHVQIRPLRDWNETKKPFAFS